MSKNVQRRQSCQNMAGQQKQRTLLIQYHAEMQELVVGFIPNFLIHICCVKTSHSESHVIRKHVGHPAIALMKHLLPRPHHCVQ